MTSNFYRLREEEDIGFLAKAFPQQFDLHTDGRLREFIKKYNGHLAHAIPEIDQLKKMRNALLDFQRLEVELLDLELDEAQEGVDDATARGDGRDMAKWRLVAEDLDQRLRKNSSFASDFWRCLAILSGIGWIFNGGPSQAPGTRCSSATVPSR